MAEAAKIRGVALIPIEEDPATVTTAAHREPVIFYIHDQYLPVLKCISAIFFFIDIVNAELKTKMAEVQRVDGETVDQIWARICGDNVAAATTTTTAGANNEQSSLRDGEDDDDEGDDDDDEEKGRHYSKACRWRLATRQIPQDGDGHGRVAVQAI